jgi:tRNA pseudouridine55 synthase
VNGANPEAVRTPDFHPAPELPSSFDAAVLAIDKPKGLSSFDVIRRLRRILNVRKIGHAGTLDPMATGLLIMLVGRATKQMETFMGMPKAYVGTIRLGESTPSYDAESEVERRIDATHLSRDAVVAASRPFVGEIDQTPPMYSAVKVGGERLYKKARRGEHIERKARRVTIQSFEIRDLRASDSTVDVDFDVACSKGTYIRSLAHDMGEVLGVGGHLVALRRTAIGPIDVEDAWTLDALAEAMSVRAGGVQP